MNRHSLIAIAILSTAAATSAYAVEGEQLETWGSSSVSREAVKADLRDLKAIGAWEPVTEASPSPLQAARWDRQIAQMQEQQSVALAQAPFVDDAGQSVTNDELVAMGSELPFDHPALHSRTEVQ
jgi:hypothetical protein